MNYNKHDMEQIAAKALQARNDFIQVVCTESFPNKLTVGKKYSGYLIKKHDSKDGIRIVIWDDGGGRNDYPIRWFKSVVEDKS